MKKRILLLITIILTISLFGCQTTNETAKTAVTVDNAQVDAAVFAYYLDTQIKSHGESPDKATAIKAAETLCADYVKLNTEFKNRELELTVNDKSQIASKVDEIWRMYGRYYETIGVHKDTITKIVMSETYKDILVKNVFGAGGDKEISDAKMKEYFNENYIFFKYFNAVLSGDEDADKETTALFKEVQNSIGKEDEDTEEEITFDDAYQKYLEEIGATAGNLSVSSMKKGEDTFPEQFFTDVQEMKTDDIKLLTYDDNIFLVQKADGSKYYSDYKTSILEYLTDTDFTKLMKDNYGTVLVTGNAEVEDEYYTLINNAKTQK